MRINPVLGCLYVLVLLVTLPFVSLKEYIDKQINKR
jgi:hypothetical protein